MQNELPHNLEAEEATIGSVLIDQDAMFDIADFLQPDMFFSPVNRMVYESILEVFTANNPLDILTVSEVLRRDDKLEKIGGEVYLTGLIHRTPTSVNVESYARIVETASMRRSMIKAAGEIAQLAFDESEAIDDVIDKSGAKFFETVEERSTQEIKPAKAVAQRYLEKIEKIRLLDTDMTGIPTGFADVDRLLGGLQDSDLVILAARPGMGKTSLQNGIGLHAALDAGKKVAMFNMEMSDEQLMQRMISSMTSIDLQRLSRGDMHDGEWRKFHKAVADIGAAGIFIDDTPALSPIQLRTKCRRLHAMHGLDLIMVDYLQLMQGDKNNSGNRVEEIGEISRGLKMLAKELNVPVLAASQLNRGVESRNDKRPVLSDLRGSGSVEQDADIVAFIYRDDYYNPETSETPNVAEINFAKHRNGATSTIELYWDAPRAKFQNLQRNEVDLNGSFAKTNTVKEIQL